MLNKNFLKKYNLFTIYFTLITIFWGAWVRLSLSGDGCGDSWPLCNKQILPESQSAIIEWLHRMTSGLSVLFIFILLILAFKIYPKNHHVRKFSIASFILILIEALIGAFLVLSGLVGLNTEKMRVLILAFHLINSLLLVGTLSLSHKTSFWNDFKIKKPNIYFALFFPLLALTGNVASLAGQLFPSLSLSQAFVLDLLPTAHISLKIRPFHPFMALLFITILGIFSYFKKHLRAVAIASLIVASFGFITLISLSPLWMKMGHLILAYVFWIFLVRSSVKKADSK